jgi:hypothetical protein
MGHHLIDDILENQKQLKPTLDNKETLGLDCIKIPINIILNTPNDQKLGELVRNELHKLIFL